MALDAATVMGMRAVRLSALDAAALAEAQLMVAEKLEAAAALQLKAVTGGLGKSPATAARRTMAHYRGKVAKNRRRLARARRS